MFIPVLYAVLIVAIYGIVAKFFNSKLKKQIHNAGNVEEAVALRKKLVAKREKVLLIYFSIVVVTLFAIAVIYPPHMFTNYVVVAALFLILRYDKSKIDIVGNVSYYTQGEFLEKNDRFYLYLRGFDDDVPFEKRNETRGNDFMEALFAKVVDYSLGVPICALGMTKEVDSPVGATRIYVDDENWKENVLELMKRAEKIFILVNNRESCIWEIKQTQSLLDKTVFIVDNAGDYTAVKDLFAAKIRMPEIPGNEQIPFFFESGKQAVHFDNTDEGHMTILGIDPETFEEGKIEERKAKMLADSKKDIVKAVVLMLVIIASLAIWIGLATWLQGVIY